MNETILEFPSYMKVLIVGAARLRRMDACALAIRGDSLHRDVGAIEMLSWHFGVAYRAR